MPFVETHDFIFLGKGTNVFGFFFNHSKCAPVGRGSFCILSHPLFLRAT